MTFKSAGELKQANEEADRQLAEIAAQREQKRHIEACYQVKQTLDVLNAGGTVGEAQIECLVETLMRTIRQPLEEKIAFQQEQIKYLRQQIEALTTRLGRMR